MFFFYRKYVSRCIFIYCSMYIFLVLNRLQFIHSVTRMDRTRTINHLYLLFVCSNLQIQRCIWSCGTFVFWSILFFVHHYSLSISSFRAFIIICIIPVTIYTQLVCIVKIIRRFWLFGTFFLQWQYNLLK